MTAPDPTAVPAGSLTPDRTMGARNRRASEGIPPVAASEGRASLSREVVLVAALELIDTEGLDALTMRRLGQRLSCDPMTLYRYAPGRAVLLDGVVELVMDRLVIPAVAPRGPASGHSGGWRGQLRSVAHGFRRLVLDHPRVAPLMVTRPLATPLGLRPLGTLRPLEQILELLISEGFDEVGALHVYRMFMGFLYGHVLNELQEIVIDPQEHDDLLRLGLYRLPLREFPRIRSLASALASYDGATELDAGLDVLFDGLTSRLDPPVE